MLAIFFSNSGDTMTEVIRPSPVGSCPPILLSLLRLLSRAFASLRPLTLVSSSITGICTAAGSPLPGECFTSDSAEGARASISFSPQPKLSNLILSGIVSN
jgi:hypothetical protein